YLIRSTQTALEELPTSLRLTAAALGADQASTIRFVLLPQAAPGIFSGIILAIGRAAEDTAVIMLTGVVVSAGIPRSLFNSYEALPFYIYYMASQFSDQQELQQGFGAALILLSLCALLFTLAWLIRKKVTKRLLYHH
ncbi:MAG: ABC transporter permease subunit, partial [Pseudomonadota bacterium]|nr:ABC transporter permease subunit [Pseudomonadota bacterium]